MDRFIPNSSGGRAGCCHRPCSPVSTVVAAPPLVKKWATWSRHWSYFVVRRWFVETGTYCTYITPHMFLISPHIFASSLVRCHVRLLLAAWQHSSIAAESRKQQCGLGCAYRTSIAAPFRASYDLAPLAPECNPICGPRATVFAARRQGLRESSSRQGCAGCKLSQR